VKLSAPVSLLGESSSVCFWATGFTRLRFWKRVINDNVYGIFPALMLIRRVDTPQSLSYYLTLFVFFLPEAGSVTYRNDPDEN